MPKVQKQMARSKMNLSEFVKDNKLRVLIKPNADKNKILGYDSSKQAIKISIKAKAEKNKANLELIKFLSKQLKRKVRIKSGLTSKEKVVSVV
jgi:uncharacterized protein (TIGR00251 family)